MLLTAAELGLADDVMSLLGVSPADSSNKGLVSQKAVRYLKQAGIELEDPAKNIAFDGKNLIVKQVTDTQKSISNVLGRSYRDDLGDHAYDDPYIQFKKSLAKDTDSPHYLASHHFFQRVVAEKEQLKLLLGLDQSGDLSLEFREDPFGVVFKNEGSRPLKVLKNIYTPNIRNFHFEFEEHTLASHRK